MTPLEDIQKWLRIYEQYAIRRRYLPEDTQRQANERTGMLGTVVSIKDRGDDKEWPRGEQWVVQVAVDAPLRVGDRVLVESSLSLPRMTPVDAEEYSSPW